MKSFGHNSDSSSIPHGAGASNSNQNRFNHLLGMPSSNGATYASSSLNPRITDTKANQASIFPANILKGHTPQSSSNNLPLSSSGKAAVGYQHLIPGGQARPYVDSFSGSLRPSIDHGKQRSGKSFLESYL
jgi:hypothetical protein